MMASPDLASTCPEIDPGRPGQIDFSVMIAWLLAALVGLAIAPTLSSHEFSNSLEALNVTTALEIRRTGNWLVPTLQGEARLVKPPLTAWVTALAIDGKTLSAVSSPDAGIRDAGFRVLAWRVRIISLIEACVTLVTTFYFGRKMIGAQVGIVSVIVMGTSLLLLRFARYSMIDLPLMMWVTIANLLLLKAIVDNQYWLGFIGAGLALAAAMLTKGPVALVQSVAPFVLYILLSRFLPRGHRPTLSPKFKWPAVIGVLIFTVVGFSWYALIYFNRAGVARQWGLELTGYDSAKERSSSWFTYALLIPYMAPWVAFFLMGTVLLAVRRRRWESLLLILLFFPILVLSCFHIGAERYLLPSLPIAAVISANAVVEHSGLNTWTALDRVINAAHWVTLGAIAIIFPIAASGVIDGIRGTDGRPWFTPVAAWTFAMGAGAIIVTAICFQRKSQWILPAVSLGIMLGAQLLFMNGYVRSAQGRSEYRPIAEQIWDQYPSAEVFNAHPLNKRPPPDLCLYLNRQIRLAANPMEIGPSSRPQVLLVPQSAAEPQPSVPAGWAVLYQPLRSGDRWWAYVRYP